MSRKHLQNKKLLNRRVIGMTKEVVPRILAQSLKPKPRWMPWRVWSWLVHFVVDL